MSQAQANHQLSGHSIAHENVMAIEGGTRRSGKSDVRNAVTTTSNGTDTILKAFNTWAYKREQPSCADRLRDVVFRAMVKESPIPFVLYWGKGPRCKIASPELACLDYLASMATRIQAAYKGGVSIRLILTDTHASLNGHAVAAVGSYFGDVTQAAAARGFDVVRLSALVAAAAGNADIAPEADTAPCGAILDSLVACAAKWYRGEGSTEGGAIEYYRMNMVEKHAVETAYPQAVFATFNGSEFRELFPMTMPIFYMYSLRRGVGVKPWFMPADDAAPNAALVSSPVVAVAHAV